MIDGWNEPNVTSISYPGLRVTLRMKLRKCFLDRELGGLVNFRVNGGLETARRVVDNLRLTSKSGSEKLLTTSDDLVTVSAGIENISDIIADFEGAFKTVFEE
ncbi:hypothetical protein BDQ17DRAFT_1382977 [Cyathus striatus]|nr:hypothetical protein BDQ17DRAFT_1382977 [Cyathus striatus]